MKTFFENDFDYELKHKDEYYFKVRGKSLEKLNQYFSDMGFVTVSAVAYSENSDVVFCECAYIFNFLYKYYKGEDKENLYKIIKEKVEKIKNTLEVEE